MEIDEQKKHLKIIKNRILSHIGSMEVSGFMDFLIWCILMSQKVYTIKWKCTRYFSGNWRQSGFKFEAIRESLFKTFTFDKGNGRHWRYWGFGGF